MGKWPLRVPAESLNQSLHHSTTVYRDSVMTRTGQWWNCYYGFLEPKTDYFNTDTSRRKPALSKESPRWMIDPRSVLVSFNARNGNLFHFSQDVTQDGVDVDFSPRWTSHVDLSDVACDVTAFWVTVSSNRLSCSYSTDTYICFPIVLLPFRRFPFSFIQYTSDWAYFKFI